MELNINVQDVSIHGVKLPLSPEIEKNMEKWLPEPLKNVSRIRQQEFVAGRFCAAKAAEKLGVQIDQLPQASSREPIWPQQVVGSISHTHGMAIGCVSLSSQLRSVGIDAEEVIKENRLYDILPLIASHQEILMVEQQCPSYLHSLAFTVLFSGKEALYKALFPICKSFIDFLEVRMNRIDLESQTFEMELLSPFSQLEDIGPIFHGSYSLHNLTVISVIRVLH